MAHIYTHTHSGSVLIVSVGLAQAHPNYAYVYSMRRRRVRCVNNSVSTHYTQYRHMSRKVTEHIPIHSIMQQSVNNTLNDLTHPEAVQEETTQFITIIVSTITIQA